LLPDGEHFLFLLWTNDVQALEEHGGVYVASISGDEPAARVVSDASSMAYAPPGHLLVMQENHLMAVPFDPDTYEVTGEATVLASDVLRNSNNGHASFSASMEGTLVFARAAAIVPPSTLQWYDRDGETAPTPVESAPFMRTIKLSPDGRRAATVLPGVTGDGEIWVVDLARGTRTRLGPSTPQSFGRPLWSPQGDRVLYDSQELGSTDFYARRADGSGDQEPLLTDDVDKTAYDWSSDGNRLVYWRVGSGVGTPDLWIYDFETQKSAVLIEGESTYVDARFSPDGRYVTYASDDSGRMEIHIHRIEDGARWQVSTAGGRTPHWSDDGREIVYMDADRRMMAVEVDLSRAEPTTEPILGTPAELFAVNDWIVAFDPAGDHSRFLFATREETAGEPLQVVLDWPAGL
jgi:WD40 repeat protein